MGAASLLSSLLGAGLLRVWGLAPALTPALAPGLAPSGTAGEMVAVAAGPFVRGATDGEPDEKPVRRLSLPAFAIDRTEVTIEAYAACVRTGACPAVPGAATPAPADGRLPAVGVSWTEAAAFCAWAGKRLPTEDEWEKAARGSDGRRYPWGDRPECQRANFGNFGGDGRCAAEGAPGRPVAVGSFPSGASPYGALDMAGNVWEWVADRYRVDAYARAPGGPAAEPSGQPQPQPATGRPAPVSRVLRGGGCCSIFGLPRAADRLALPEDYRDVDIGFRCARGVAAPAQTGSARRPAGSGAGPVTPARPGPS